MGTTMIRKSAIALAVAASIGGGGFGIAHAAGTGTHAGTYASSSSASYLADQAVRAWGVGDRATANRYLSSGTANALFGWRSVGGSHWVRTGVRTGNGVTYVSYRSGNDTLTLTVTNSRLGRMDRVVTYVSYWNGGRSGYTSKGTNTYTGTNSGTGSGVSWVAGRGNWVATTNGYGPVRLGANAKSLAKAGYLRNLNSCNPSTYATATVRGAKVWVTNGRVSGIDLTAGQRTRMGIQIGDSEAKLKRTYGNQLRSEYGIGYNTMHHTLRWSDGRLILFITESGKNVTHIMIHDGQGLGVWIEGGGPDCR